MSNNWLPRGELMKKVYVRLLVSILVLLAMFLLPAGTLAYWEAWVYLVILFIPMVLVLIYLIKNDPELLERRMRMRENRYASRVVEVEQEQQVISSGPYAIVRHPMYLGVLLMYIFSPLALGSYWAMIPALLIIPLLVFRIWNEESVLVRELKGYQAYLQKTRYRLIRGIW